jgi:hypothetical protein
MYCFDGHQCSSWQVVFADRRKNQQKITVKSLSQLKETFSRGLDRLAGFFAPNYAFA